MRDFYIKTVGVEFSEKEHYQVGFNKPTTGKRGAVSEEWFAVSAPFYNKAEADKFLTMMRRNERIYEERLERERDEFYIRKSHRKGKIW